MNRAHRSLPALAASVVILSLAPMAAWADELSDLVAILRSDTAPAEKDVACRRLAVVGTADAVDALAALLADPQLATSARTALEVIPGPEASAALRQALVTMTGTPLIGVIESVGTRRDVESIPVLARLLRSDDAMAATAAAYALGRIGGGDAASALVGALTVPKDSVRAAIGTSCIACSDGLAASGDRRAALRIADAVRRADLPSAILASAVHRSVLWRGDAGVVLLTRHLHSNDAELCGAALRLIREMPGERVTAAVCGALDDIPAMLRVPVIQALGHRADAAALDTLASAATSMEREVSIAACRALAQIGDPRAVDALLNAAMSSEESVAEAAANALAALRGEGVDEAVADRLDDADPRIRAVAVRAAGQRRMVGAVPALIAAVEAEGEVREAAISALGQTCTADDLPQLVDILVGLSSPDEVRLAESAISNAASRVDDKQVVADALIARLQDAPTEPKRAMLRLLTTAPTTRALDAVRAATSEEAVRETAYAVLGEWPDPAAAPDLLALAKAGGQYRELGLRGYIRLIGSPELTPEEKMAMCREAEALVSSDGEKDQLLGALATVPTVEALEMVMSYLDNPALTGRACWAAVTIAEPLEQSHPRQVVDALTRVLEVMDNPNMERRVRSSRDRAAEAAGL